MMMIIIRLKGHGIRQLQNTRQSRLDGTLQRCGFRRYDSYCGKAIVVNNKVEGVVSIDLSLNSLNKLSKSKMPYDGYAFIWTKRDNARPPVKTGRRYIE
ncbi:hypothetical protein PO124_06755 [Bacillus licheniformis]|nr:hypothetical protein [Bacillus licheniformis]